MGHKRYVVKNGKVYGPYIYESYRDSEGNVKKRYLGRHHESKQGEFMSLGFIALVMFFSFAMLVKVLFQKFF
jgi:hypothetical protein